MIDVHAHLNDENLENNIQEILDKCKTNNVQKILCVGTKHDTSLKAIKLAEKHCEIFAVIGFHPEYAKHFNEESVAFLEEYSKHPKVVAIGEIGLDYHYPPFDKELQKEIFVKQLKIAHNAKLPVQIHTRDAIFDTIEILKNNKHLLEFGGIVHCFSENLESLEELKKLGLKISVGGIVTFKNAKQLQEVVQKTPLDMIMLETDCPYLTPHPFRSKLNDPSYVYLTAEKIADLKNISVKEVIRQTTLNAEKLFKI